MKTSAENRRIRQLLSGIQSGEITPRPDFQRKLVWSNNDKLSFLDTVLRGYPFPEIYLAIGEVNLETAAGTELLVDGQQRVTTLHQYFTASDALRLMGKIAAYKELSVDRQTEFLNYEVAVRNLGIITEQEIRDVFQRINSTSYTLNAMEVHNARYRGPLKQCAEDIAQLPFFDDHHIFSAREIRRMQDTVFLLTVIISMISTYFHRDSELESFLDQYNDEFPQEAEVRERIASVLRFIEACEWPNNSRAWKRADLLVLIVEIDRLLNKERKQLKSERVGPAITSFYDRVESEMADPSGEEPLQSYFKTTVQATNDRSSRVNRGRIIRDVIAAA